MRVATLTLTVLLLTRAAPARVDAVAAARTARTEVTRLLTRLADEARARGDVTAAQGIAETAAFVGGVPHPLIDTVRGELVRGAATETADDLSVAAAWKAVRPLCDVLARSPRHIDIVDARLIRQVPEVLPAVRYINTVRRSLGLAPMRYDAKRSIRPIAALRELPRALDWTRYWASFSAKTPLEAARELLAPGTPAVHRGMAFLPADKGILVGTWLAAPDGDGRRALMTCFAPSGNTDPLIPVSGRVTWPQDAIGVPCRSAEVAAHFFPRLASKPRATATLRGGAREQAIGVRVLRAHGHTVVAVKPGPLEPRTRYKITLLAADGETLVRWRFTTGEAAVPSGGGR